MKTKRKRRNFFDIFKHDRKKREREKKKEDFIVKLRKKMKEYFE